MFANTILRIVKYCVPNTRRRQQLHARRVVSMEARVLLAAQLGFSPAASVSAAAKTLAAGPQGAPLYPLGDTFNLSSRPSATKTICLDFDGHTFSGTAWNGDNNGQDFTLAGYTYEGDATFSNNELESIQVIWARVAEDFAPFDVNVTTKLTAVSDIEKSGSGDQRWGIRVVIGETYAPHASAGGVAYIGSFNWDKDTPALVFENNLGSEKAIAEATSHEIGHTLFLGHDGRSTPNEGYYGGHGTGDTSWGPIMGVGYYTNLVQWSKGEYANANNAQDDIETITTQNGFGFRADDAANNASGAAKIAALKAASIYNVDQKGVIERRTDFDFFRIDAGNGQINLNISGGPIDSNIDILAELYDADGVLVASSNPDDKLTATINFTATLGAYYLKIDGVGKGDPLGTGYSDYGSLGQYRITGTYADPENSPPVINDQSLPAVRESSPIGTIVGDVVAFDPNDDQTLAYSIIAGNTGGTFAIHATTGRITVANPAALDWEVNQVFNLTVQVTDNGTPVRTDTGVVTIEVLDVTTFSFNSGVLTVKGTHLNDKITVLNSGDTIKINDGLSLINTAISAASVTTINLLGLAGNDSLRLDSTLGTAKTSTISGGQGNDTLISSLGKDTLNGDQGTDEVSYIQATNAVTVSLLVAGSQNTGGSEVDTLVAIENLTGSNFGDTLTGNGNANALRGGLGNDSLFGNGGNDTLEGGAGADSLIAGEDDDTLIFDTADLAVSGAAGTDTAVLVNPTSAVNLSLLTGQIEIVNAAASIYNNKFDATGAAWAVKITGGKGRDTILGGSGNDTIEGGEGNDSIIGGGGADSMIGGHGDDTLRFDQLDTSVSGGSGKDKAIVSNATGAVNLNLAAAQLEIVDASASTFNNTLSASDAVWNVTILGGSGNDLIVGGKAVDVLSGGAGKDTMSGGLGNDTIDGGSGIDSLEGGEGNDSLLFDSVDAVVNGGNGTDSATMSAATDGMTLNLVTSKLETVNASKSTFANKFDATGASWIVNITGGSGADSIFGGNLNDKLYGGLGTDSMIGGAGNDYLNGGTGVDTISYATATARVEVNLTTGRAVGGGGTDILIGFENLIGSNFNDLLMGTTGANIIRGGLGIDTILGGGGTDSIIQD